MSIQEYLPPADVDSTIGTILESLPADAYGFQQAIQLYGSDFFKGESPSFQAALCKALQVKFAGVSHNPYWDKYAS